MVINERAYSRNGMWKRSRLLPEKIQMFTSERKIIRQMIERWDSRMTDIGKKKQIIRCLNVTKFSNLRGRSDIFLLSKSLSFLYPHL